MDQIKLPLTVRRSLELVGLFLVGTLVYIGRDVLTPLLLAFFLAIILLPIHRGLRRYKVPETLAIVFSLALVVIIVAMVVWFFSLQISNLISDLPQIISNVKHHLSSISAWIGSAFGITAQKQAEMISQYSAQLIELGGQSLGGALGSLTEIFLFFGLLPIYIFLILLYRNLLIRFVFLWFPQERHKKVEEVVRESEIIIKSYLIGLLIQIAYVTILLALILSVLGIRHAILIGFLFALLNLIPYIGGLFGIIIALLLTLASSTELWPIFAVLGAIGAVQFIDNNILMPRIVGGKVKINALAAIVGVVIGGSLAGISGMFLSLPVMAVLKVVFDRTTNMKQWGVLLGDENPEKSPMVAPMLRSKSEAVQEKLRKENEIEPLVDE